MDLLIFLAVIVCIIYSPVLCQHSNEYTWCEPVNIAECNELRAKTCPDPTCHYTVYPNKSPFGEGDDDWASSKKQPLQQRAIEWFLNCSAALTWNLVTSEALCESERIIVAPFYYFHFCAPFLLRLVTIVQSSTNLSFPAEKFAKQSNLNVDL